MLKKKKKNAGELPPNSIGSAVPRETSCAPDFREAYSCLSLSSEKERQTKKLVNKASKKLFQGHEEDPNSRKLPINNYEGSRICDFQL